MAMDMLSVVVLENEVEDDFDGIQLVTTYKVIREIIHKHVRHMDPEDVPDILEEIIWNGVRFLLRIETDD